MSLAARAVSRVAAAAFLLVPAALAPVVAAGPAMAQQGGQRPPTPVTVRTLSAQNVTITASLPGRVVASGTAEVRPQVTGLITERLFEEGAEVKTGDPLYRIDDATYQAAVQAAEAAVAQAEATLKGQNREEERVRRLLERAVATQSDLDSIVSTRDAAAAALKVAQAQLVSAKIDLDRTEITAPLDGVIGRSLTTRGALVTAGQASPLAVIRAIDPVLVDVTQSAAEIVAWRRGEGAKALSGADLTVKLFLADGLEYEHEGELTAAEPHVDEQTGVVTLRMSYPNPEGLLLPGMYALVEAPQGVIENAVLAPQQGVSRDRRGRPTALVVNAQNVVEQRVLKVQGARGDAWIVTEGLSDGERIIIEGLQKTGPGATVSPEEAPADDASQTASAAQQ